MVKHKKIYADRVSDNAKTSAYSGISFVCPKKEKTVKLTPDERIAIERAEDDIKHSRFSSHEEIMKILRSKK
jgi:hypothetical protein